MPLLALLYFLTLVSWLFLGLSALTDPPDYEGLHTVSGELLYKEERGGGKVNRDYAIYLMVDDYPERFHMEYALHLAYGKLAKGDQVELKVEDGESFIYELKANDKLLVSFERVVKAHYTDSSDNVKLTAIILTSLSLLTLLPLMILYLRLSKEEKEALGERAKKRREEKRRNKKYTGMV